MDGPGDIEAVLAAHAAGRIPIAALKDEAFIVITSVISTTAQLNLSAAMAVLAASPAEDRSPEEQEFVETYAAGVAWIQAVRRRMHRLADLGGVAPEGEQRWPEPEQSVIDLVEKY